MYLFCIKCNNNGCQILLIFFLSNVICCTLATKNISFNHLSEHGQKETSVVTSWVSLQPIVSSEAYLIVFFLTRNLVGELKWKKKKNYWFFNLCLHDISTPDLTSHSVFAWWQTFALRHFREDLVVWEDTAVTKKKKQLKTDAGDRMAKK